MSKPKTLGIIGGLGSEASCAFTLNVNNKIKSRTKKQPHIILENLPITTTAERKLINGDVGNEHKELLLESINRLNKVQTDLIVITCNTVHVFIDDLRSSSLVPILSIIEECVAECAERGISKVGLLASTKSIQEELHLKQLNHHRIEAVIPNQEDQRKVSDIIVKIIEGSTNRHDKRIIFEIVKKLKKRGAEAVLLGCTDLHLLVSEIEGLIPLIDSCKILENKVIGAMI